MIYELIEASAADLGTNFATYFAAVVASKTGLPGGLSGTAIIYKRQPAEIFLAVAQLPGAAARLPGIGVYAEPGAMPGPQTASTQSKSVGTRKAIVRLALDYVFRGPDPSLAVLQAELAVEALCKHIDALAGKPGVVNAGGDPVGSVLVNMFDVIPAGEDYYEQRVLVTAPGEVWDNV